MVGLNAAGIEAEALTFSIKSFIYIFVNVTNRPSVRFADPILMGRLSSVILRRFTVSFKKSSITKLKSEFLKRMPWMIPNGHHEWNTSTYRSLVQRTPSKLACSSRSPFSVIAIPREFIEPTETPVMTS